MKMQRKAKERQRLTEGQERLSSTGRGVGEGAVPGGRGRRGGAGGVGWERAVGVGVAGLLGQTGAVEEQPRVVEHPSGAALIDSHVL